MPGACRDRLRSMVGVAEVSPAAGRWRCKSWSVICARRVRLCLDTATWQPLKAAETRWVQVYGARKDRQGTNGGVVVGEWRLDPPRACENVRM
jgi:hypothetical protein